MGNSKYVSDAACDSPRLATEENIIKNNTQESVPPAAEAFLLS